MKTIIAGSRDIDNYFLVRHAIKSSKFHITEVVSGGARGIDRLGERWARDCGMIPKVFKAYWDKHGRGAGHKRNREMAKYGDALIAVWDGMSPGTRGMLDLALTYKLKIYLVLLISSSDIYHHKVLTIRMSHIDNASQLDELAELVLTSV